MKTVSDGAVLPASELAVMTGIWGAYEDLGRPVTTREVLAHAPELGRLNMTTVLTFIGRLCGRGFIRIEKTGPMVGRVNAYTPLVDRSYYQRIAFTEFVENTMRGDRAELARLVIASMTPEELKTAKQKL